MRKDQANKLKIGTHKYPSTVGTAAQHQHYVTFNIIVRGKSKYNTENRTEINDSFAGAADIENAADNIKKAAGGLVAGSAVAALGAAGILAKFKPQSATQFSNALSNSIAKNSATLAKGALVTAATGFAITAFKPDTKQRISDSITLALQTGPSVAYNADYKDTELGLLAAAGSSAVDNITNGGGGEVLKRLALGLSGGSNLFGLDVRSNLEFSSKEAVNPFRELLFKSVDRRKFTFEYKFMPASEDESKEVDNIIKLFKFHMHPELSAGDLFYIYPSEFEISYYYKGEENKFYHKIATCALVDMQINYNSEGFTSFANGAPTSISMKLTFEETVIHNKKSIKEDNY